MQLSVNRVSSLVGENLGVVANDFAIHEQLRPARSDFQ